MSSRDEMVMDLIGATNMDFESAISALESSGWNLQRCLNAHLGGGGHAGGSFGGADDDNDGVRAPILPRTEVLAGPASLARAVRPPPTAASFNTNSFDTARTNQRDFRAEGRFGGAANAKNVKLAELFRPPTDLLFVGTYDEAIERAKAMKLWLVVNVQDVQDFDSQRLNRDTWSDGSARALLQSSCVFMQLPFGTLAAREFLQLYPCQGTVSVAVIDPRTGERVLRWDGFLSSEEFTTRLSDVIDRLPLDSFHNPQRGGGGGAAAGAGGSTRQRDNPVAAAEPKELTEDEQIAAAIAASLLESTPATVREPTPPPQQQKRKSVPESAAVSTTRERSPVQTPKRRNVATTVADDFVAVPLQSESDANASECVIMVRLLNGQRIKCGFAASATLADLYRYVAQHGFGGEPAPAEGFALTLQLPTRVFSGDQLAQTTMADAKLQGRALVLVTALQRSETP